MSITVSASSSVIRRTVSQYRSASIIRLSGCIKGTQRRNTSATITSAVGMDKSSNLILWKGLKELYCATQLQNSFNPSDLLWCHKIKNIYLLELERAVKEEKWRQWLNICYGVITPLNESQSKNIDALPSNPDFVINSNALKTLIPFLIEQTLNDKYLQKSVLDRLTPIHSQQILKQFRDRIQRSDIQYIALQRNKFIAKYGNNPLKRFLQSDVEFTNAINAKLDQLSQIDPDLALKFKQCWTQTDHAFIRFTSETETQKHVETETKTETEENENVKTAKDELIAKSVEYFVSKVPSSYRCHQDLLRHTLDDCSKLTMLDPGLLKEGYSGDNGHHKWGLWKANHLPMITLRPHLLRLRDMICNKHLLGAYIEITGKYGTGKSLALMYAVNIARKLNTFIVIYCPDAHAWVQQIQLTVPANDKPCLFYQHHYAREFFKTLMVAEGEKLRTIALSNEYTNLSEKKQNDSNKNVDLEMVYEMLEDPVDIKRFESKIINEWMQMGSTYRDEQVTGISEWVTLYDMVQYGQSMDCKYPASLMYDFIDEIKKQKVFNVLIACDNIDWWNNFVYGLTTPRNPKVLAWQLSMVDIFSQFQQINALQNGMVIMSRTTMSKKRSPQFKTHPSHIIHCPDIYTNDEFDSMMWNYQGIKLCSPNIAPDDYKKVYAASAKRPIHVQRLSALF
eukprot:182141_1